MSATPFNCARSHGPDGQMGRTSCTNSKTRVVSGGAPNERNQTGASSRQRWLETNIHLVQSDRDSQIPLFESEKAKIKLPKPLNRDRDSEIIENLCNALLEGRDRRTLSEKDYYVGIMGTRALKSA